MNEVHKTIIAIQESFDYEEDPNISIIRKREPETMDQKKEALCCTFYDIHLLCKAFSIWKYIHRNVFKEHASHVSISKNDKLPIKNVIVLVLVGINRNYKDRGIV